MTLSDQPDWPQLAPTGQWCIDVGPVVIATFSTTPNMSALCPSPPATAGNKIS